MKKLLKTTNILLFISFIILLTYLTLFKNFVGRTNGKYNINLIPFKTIYTITTDFINNKSSLEFFLRNIFGNLIAFTPFAYFFTNLFKIKNIKTYTIIIFLIILTIETLQLILKIGVFDIDDIILNLLGSIVAFQLLTKIINNYHK